MKTKWAIPLMLLGLATSSASSAQGAGGGPGTAYAAKKGWRQARESKKVKTLAVEFNVPESDVQALRDRKMGWSDARKTLSVAQQARKPVSEVAQLREAGLGWNEIYNKYDLKPMEPEGTLGTQKRGASSGGEIPPSPQ